jgi:hypothetical protein
VVKAEVKTTKDQTAQMFKSLMDLAKVEVLVGIPQETSSRGSKITNAELAFIHTHGVRSKSMQQEMGQNIQLAANGAPFTVDYNKFLDNLGKMTYGSALNLYIHEHGSPMWHIPPRPIIEPAINDPENKKVITDDLREAAQAALDGHTSTAKTALKKAGMDAQNLVRQWFVNPKNKWAQNAPSTIAAKGSSNSLIDHGELRRAIVYVIREKGNAENLAMGRRMSKAKATQV